MDIETRTFGKPDPQKDRLRIFGCYSYKTNKYYMLKDKAQIQKVINAHKFLVGFNNVGTKIEPGYDNPILIREGIDLKYKTCIDLKSIFKQRASQMKTDVGMLGDEIMQYSLKYITELLGIVSKKESKLDIDYKIFQKEMWTEAELKEILIYTKRDIEVTKKLYDWVEDYFVGFKDYLTEEDVRKKIYLTASLPKIAVKAICKEMGWELKLNQATDGLRIKGAYVSYPAGEYFKGDIYCLDFNSLYPHITMQCNLYGRKKDASLDDRPTWNGSGKWKVKGEYYSDTLSPICKIFQKWYAQRKHYQKIGDKREYSLKIFLNIGTYGVMKNLYYGNVYDIVAAGDCTALGAQWTMFARTEFKVAGYKVVYTDTDSVYVIDHLNDRAKLMGVVKKIITEIKTTVPFPQETFAMGVDDEIKYMYFFKDSRGKK